MFRILIPANLHFRLSCYSLALRFPAFLDVPLINSYTMAERPEDLNLPNAVITRIIKEAIPDGVNVSKEARLAISKAASVFVLYATSCSNNFALRSKRKTINAQDVLSAMQDMEFDQFLDPLKFCLESFRREQQGKKEASEKRKKAKEETIVIDCDEEDEDEDDDDDDEDEEEEEEENDVDSMDGNEVYSKDEDYVESDE
ncbi:POLE3 [Acanthosepion pharaonis]|uniref:DNA polymerase epsilon subunit 3 n=1 Tax=Acanthosepion pharaonis TaxID=158019 RepID=A0A812CLG9_ACAPH|nr:POLE3 [Sepia pharaonis]